MTVKNDSTTAEISDSAVVETAKTAVVEYSNPTADEKIALEQRQIGAEDGVYSVYANAYKEGRRAGRKLARAVLFGSWQGRSPEQIVTSLLEGARTRK